MTSIQAVTVDPAAPDRLAIAAVESPVPTRMDALVRVRAVSLNLGEVRRIASADAGWRPGWDLAGTVERAAEDGSGPRAGERVVGMMDSGAWAEMVAIPANRLAVLPDSVSFTEAASLPVAGLTALRALERGGLLLERNVLVTGASGGVGHLACQLAVAAGAQVVGVVSRRERESVAREAGAREVVTEDDLERADTYGPYHLILESVGGEGFKQRLTMIAPSGTCVLYGTSAGPDLDFEGRTFYGRGGVSLYGFILFYEVAHNPPGRDLGRLATMIAEGRLRPEISVEAPWTEIGRVARDLAERRIAGKAILTTG